MNEDPGREQERRLDAADVAAVRAGERGLRDRLVDRHRERLRVYLATMLGDEAGAEDLVQESFRRAFERLGELAEAGRFGAWLRSIAINLCRDALRARVREERRGDEAAARAVRHSVLSSILRRESAELLALAIDRLPILLREAFVLHHVERLSYRDMAEMTGASEGALQVRSHRARALLKQQLGSAFDTHFGV